VTEISWIYYSVSVTELKNVSYPKFKFRFSYRDYLFKVTYLIIRNFETHKIHTTRLDKYCTAFKKVRKCKRYILL